MLEAAREALPELPAARAERLERELSLTADSSRQLAFRTEFGDFFEAAVASQADPPPSPQALANWVLGDLVARLPDGEDPGASLLSPGALAALVGLVGARRVSVGAARQVLDRLLAEGGDPQAIVAEEGLGALDGGSELKEIVAAALRANADAAERVRSGNAKAIGPIIGYVMRETKGRADGREVTRLVNEALDL